MFKSNLLFNYSSDQISTGVDDQSGWVFGTNGIKRAGSKELAMEYGLPPKFPAYCHPWAKSEGTMNPFDLKLVTPDKFSSADADIEAELAEGVAQSLNLNEGSSKSSFIGRKRKVRFSKELSTTGDDDMLGVQSQNSKRMKMDWEDDSEEPGLVLSKEVKSVMSDLNAPDLISSPESLIIERIRKQNSMALMPYVPPQHTIQEKDSNQNHKRKDDSKTSCDDDFSDDEGDFDLETLPIENIRIDEQNSTSPSDAMEEDSFDEINL